MKKVLYILLSVFIIFACIVACDDNASKSKITPVTPIGPEEPEPVIVNNYITFKSSAPFSIVPSYDENIAQWDGQLFYSTNTKDWIEFPRNAITTATSALTEGSHYLYFRGLGNTVITSDTDFELEATSDISCSGNIMNLLDYKKVEQEQDITMGGDCFCYMFNGWDYLTDVSELKLPALTLSDSCYLGMFMGTKIITAPELPATTLAKLCYNSMFEDCVNLTGTVELPATSLATSCYTNMFYNCSSLTGCVIKATLFAEDSDSHEGCCEEMFEDCTSLTSLTVSFTNWGTSNTNSKDATDDWVLCVASSGTFTCPGSLPLTTGSDYIPEGWTVVNGLNVTGVTLNTTSTKLENDSITLVATVLPENASNKNVSWDSSNPQVATVGPNGVVTPTGLGTTTITVTTQDGNKTATCIVKVTAPTRGNSQVGAGPYRYTCDWVQLWEGGPRWATMNVGSTATDYQGATTYTNDIVGGYYNWGTTIDRRTSPSDNTYCSSTTDIQKSGYDTAYTLWDDNWMMPTKDMFSSMTDNVTITAQGYNNAEGSNSLVKWTWCNGNTTKYTTNCSLKGWKVSGLGDYENNSIFFPVAGYNDGSYKDVDDNGYYYSSTSVDANVPWRLKFTGRNSVSVVGSGHGSKQDGCLIRPVRNEVF